MDREETSFQLYFHLLIFYCLVFLKAEDGGISGDADAVGWTLADIVDLPSTAAEHSGLQIGEQFTVRQSLHADRALARRIARCQSRARRSIIIIYF